MVCALTTTKIAMNSLHATIEDFATDGYTHVECSALNAA